MIIELEKLDHAILLEEEKCILMLIFDSADIWNEKKSKLFFDKQKQKHETDAKHYIYLRNKVENYCNYILNEGLITNFPEIKDKIDEYKYEIRLVTDFKPEEWYIEAVKELNDNIKMNTNKNIITTIETKES